MHGERDLLISPDGLKPASLQISPENIFDLVTPTIRDLDVKVTSGTKLRDMVELERDRWREARARRLPYGLYGYFADKGHLVHYPPRSLWEAAQTISSATLYRDFGLEGSFEEMRALVRREVPAVAGCSVGRRIAEGLFCYHFGHMKLADKKCGHPAGNNRAPHTYEEMTRHDSKAVSLARRLYAEDGLAALSVYRDGVHDGNIDDFVSGNPDVAEPPATIVFEETDDLLTKLDLRIACRRARVPYAMITDLGRWSLVDFYDFARATRRDPQHRDGRKSTSRGPATVYRSPARRVDVPVRGRSRASSLVAKGGGPRDVRPTADRSPRRRSDAAGLVTPRG
jgi:hypothetical protein